MIAKFLLARTSLISLRSVDQQHHPPAKPPSNNFRKPLPVSARPCLIRVVCGERLPLELSPRLGAVDAMLIIPDRYTKMERYNLCRKAIKAADLAKIFPS